MTQGRHSPKNLRKVKGKKQSNTSQIVKPTKMDHLTKVLEHQRDEDSDGSIISGQKRDDSQQYDGMIFQRPAHIR